jgi:multisubunit Na+/H+ antiporter MnhE subunit
MLYNLHSTSILVWKFVLHVQLSPLFFELPENVSFIIIILLLLTAIGLSPGGSSPTLVQQNKYKTIKIQKHIHILQNI